MWAPNTLIYVYFNFNLASADVQYQYVITFAERRNRRKVSTLCRRYFSALMCLSLRLISWLKDADLVRSKIGRI